MLKYTHLLSQFRSWTSLEQEIANLAEPKVRGDVFEEFCLAYLKLTPEYQLKNVWIQGQFPTRVIEELKLSGQKDQGIDLVAETNSGKLWAIQAKFRSDRKGIVSYKELSTFLAVSDRADYRLIISNTEQLPSIIGKRSRCGEALIDRLSVLDESYFDRLHKFLELGKPVEATPLSPKPHQKDAIAASIEHYRTHDRGQLIMACGSGKTLTAVWIAEQLGSQKILVMVPSLALMRQTVSVWAENFKSQALNYLCICSDASVAEEAKSDRPVGNLWELDIPVTTDFQEAKQLILDNSNNRLIVFSTYQSSDVLSKAVAGSGEFRFDLAICDEAHRTAGMNKGLFNLVLDDKHIPCHKRLFMTATPRILDKHIIKRGQEEDVELFSMADETKYGKEVYRLSFGEAIRLKLLCDFKVAVAVVTDDEVRQIISLRSKVQLKSEKIFEREAEGLAKQIAFIKAVSQYGIKHTISFHSRVADAQSFSDKKSDRGLGAVNDLMSKHNNKTPQIATFHVNGAVPAGQRSATISEFSSSPVSVISNARCLTEGVDIPSVDGVVFYDPKYRLTDIVQATGRALRLYKGKACGYLIIPVFLKSDESPDDLLESSDFSQVWSVIKAMQSQDERLDEIIKSLRVMDGQIDGGQKEACAERNSLEEKLHEKILIQGIPNRISAEQFIRKIDIKLLDELGSSWDYKFGILKAFRKLNPYRWPIANEEFPKGNTLGSWCVKQRQRHRNNKVTLERVDLLTKIGFIWGKKQVLWETQYKYLVQFRKLNPDRWPTSKEEFPMVGNELGLWCVTQRARKYKKSQEQIDLLNKIGFAWAKTVPGGRENSKVPKRKANWEAQFNNLVKFMKQNPGRWPNSTEEFPIGNKLGSWCTFQRKQKNEITEVQRVLLNKIGFTWKASLWDERYEKLVQFRKDNPDRWPSHGEELATWCYVQRMKSKKGKLSQKQVSLLNKIKFYEVLQKYNRWTTNYEALLYFRERNPDRWPTGNEKEIYDWLCKQRALYKCGKLPQDQIDVLNKLGFPWVDISP